MLSAALVMGPLRIKSLFTRVYHHICPEYMRGTKGETGGPDPLKNHENIMSFTLQMHVNVCDVVKISAGVLQCYGGKLEEADDFTLLLT